MPFKKDVTLGEMYRETRFLNKMFQLLFIKNEVPGLNFCSSFSSHEKSYVFVRSYTRFSLRA